MNPYWMRETQNEYSQNDKVWEEILIAVMPVFCLRYHRRGAVSISKRQSLSQ